MRKLLLLLVVTSVAINALGQQKYIDSFTIELKNHPREDIIRLMLLSKLAGSYEEVNPDKGIETANQNIQLAKKLNSIKWLAHSYNDKGANFLQKGMFDSALILFNQALSEFKKINDLDGMGQQYGNIGVLYYYKSDYINEIKNETKAIELIENSSRNIKKIAAGYDNLAIAYEGLSDYISSLNYYLKAFQIYEKANDSLNMAQNYGNIVEIYRAMGNYTKALDYGFRGIDISKKTNNFYALTLCYGMVGQVYYYMHDNKTAINYYLKALAIADKYKFVNFQSVFYQMAGSAYSTIQDYPNALNYITKSIVLLKLAGDKITLSQSYDELGKIYLNCPGSFLQQQGINPSTRYSTVLRYQNKGLVLAKEANALEREEIVWGDISSTYEAQKNYSKALDAYKQAFTLKDSVLNGNTEQQITRLEMQYQFNKTQDSTKAITDKQQALAKAEIQKQHVIENAMMAGAGFLILAGIGGFAFYKRNKNIKTEKNEAELKSQITETEMKALRAQMNPHFIFNSLNSISDYIDKNQTEIASDFTAKFAKLMRMVLENSEQKEIPLADDLKALELYIQLESMRLKNKFSYEIHVDENIDKENTLVPPLILQPFVENSIWHGIANKESAGNIKIYIKQQNEMINCIVEDDGTGIQETDTESKEKKSLGMKITKARIDMINKLKNTNASVTVFNRQQGVRAEVKLPLELSF